MTDDEKNITPEEENNTEEPELEAPETEAEIPAEAEAAPEEQPQTATRVQPAPPSAAPTSTKSGMAQLGEVLGSLPGIVWWGILIVALLVVIFTLTNTDLPEPVYTEAEQTATADFELLIEAGTAAPDIQATSDAILVLQEEMAANEEEAANQIATLESNVANATATIGAFDAMIAEQSDELATAQAQAELNTNLALNNAATAESALLALQEAESSADELATAQAELESSNNALATAQAEANALATAQAEVAEQADLLDNAEVLQAQVENMQEDMIAFQADATTRALQMESMQATMEASGSDDIAATVTAQAEVIATQAAQLEAIQEAIGQASGE